MEMDTVLEVNLSHLTWCDATNFRTERFHWLVRSRNEYTLAQCSGKMLPMKDDSSKNTRRSQEQCRPLEDEYPEDTIAMASQIPRRVHTNAMPHDKYLKGIIALVRKTEARYVQT